MSEPLRDTEPLCETCGHPWSRHTSGGMCTGAPPDGSECYCVLFPPEPLRDTETIRKTQAFVDEIYPAIDRLVGRLQAAEQERLRRIAEGTQAPASAARVIARAALSVSPAPTLTEPGVDERGEPLSTSAVSPAPSEPA